MNLLTFLGGWLDNRLDMHLSFDGDLMTPDWSVDDGDPVLRPERKPATLTAGMYDVEIDSVTPLLPPVATYPVKVRILTPKQHATRLKERGQ